MFKRYNDTHRYFSIIKITALAAVYILQIILPGNAKASDPIPVASYKIYGCNASSFGSIPGRDGSFIGRRLITTNVGNGCNGPWTLVLAAQDKTRHEFNFIHDVLQLPAQIEGGARLANAFDASVVNLNGDYWVAFECSGPGIPGASTCVGPLVSEEIDTRQVYVLVEGGSTPYETYNHSAGVPKFLQYNGSFYLYWGSITSDKISRRWISLSTRGMELTYDPHRNWPILAKNATGPVRSVDPNYNVEVWQNADMSSIQPWKGKFIATAGITSATCLKPSDPIPGCYHTIIGISPEPLAVNGFRELTDLQSQIPSSPAEYVRLVLDKNGQASLIGHFVRPPVTDERTIPPGIDEVPIVLP